MTIDDIFVPPANHFMINNFRVFLGSAFLFWYLDHLISSNRGASQSFYFPLQPSYWINVFPCLDKIFCTFCKKKSSDDLPVVEKKDQNLKRKAKKVTDADLGLGLDEEETFDSVVQEEMRIREDEQEGIVNKGLRVLNIQKTYRANACGGTSKKDVHAVRGIFLEVPRNELLCLLGHNGAGKSTFFNMLTGMLSPSGGYAKIAGFDIRT